MNEKVIAAVADQIGGDTMRIYDKLTEKKKKAAKRLQRLLNADFDGKEFEVVIAYENSVKSGSENRQQAID